MMQGLINNHNAFVGSMNAQMAAANQKVAANNAQIQAVTAKAAALENKIAAQTTETAAVKAGYEADNNRIKNLVTDTVTKQLTQVREFYTKSDQLYDRAQTLETSNESQKRRLQELAASLHQLKETASIYPPSSRASSVMENDQ